MFDRIFVADDGRGHGRDASRLARYLSTSTTSFALGSLRSPVEDADLIVIGAGRDAHRLLNGSPIPVAVAPREYAAGPEDRIRVIGVGFDGQPESVHALHAAEQLALERGATLRVFAVVAPGDAHTSWSGITADNYVRLVRESLGEQLREAVQALDPSVRAASSLISGDPVRELTARSREGLDLLVVGSRGYGPIRRVVFGSVSGELIDTADCPVLVLPRTTAIRDETGDDRVAAPVR
jgi:nucleotide-binding universal stress UspA family protein